MDENRQHVNERFKSSYKGECHNLKDGEMDITFRNPSKVWRFNKMSLAVFLKKYWK